MARRKTLFDDRPVEISELTYIIKHDIAAINKQLVDLQAFNKAQKSGKADRAEEHRGNVVTLLQSKLAGATTSFQDILEVRTQNMKASKDRSEQFMFGNTNPAAVGGMQENSGEFQLAKFLEKESLIVWLKRDGKADKDDLLMQFFVLAQNSE